PARLVAFEQDRAERGRERHALVGHRVAVDDALPFDDVEVVGVVADLVGAELSCVDAERGRLLAADAEVEGVTIDDEARAFGEPAALHLRVGEGREHPRGVGLVPPLDGEALVDRLPLGGYLWHSRLLASLGRTVAGRNAALQAGPRPIGCGLQARA